MTGFIVMIESDEWVRMTGEEEGEWEEAWRRYCRRPKKPTVTKTQRRRVAQRHAVNEDIMQSGFMLKWMDELAGRTAREYVDTAEMGTDPEYVDADDVVTAATDRVRFHEPVRVGDAVQIQTRIDAVGTSSMMIHLDVDVFDRETQSYNDTVDAYYTFVALHEGAPTSVPRLQIDRDNGEEDMQRGRLARTVQDEMKRLATPVKSDTEEGYSHIISLDQTNPSGRAHGGELMRMMEEEASITAEEYAAGAEDAEGVVTAGMDRMQFLEPVEVWDEVLVKPRLDYVGNSSMMVHTDAYVEKEDEYRHVGTAYFPYVAVDSDWNPVPLPEKVPQTREELERYERAHEHKVRMEETQFPL